MFAISLLGRLDDLAHPVSRSKRAFEHCVTVKVILVSEVTNDEGHYKGRRTTNVKSVWVYPRKPDAARYTLGMREPWKPFQEMSPPAS